MTTIYLIRHAEAEGNLYRRIHGWYDALVTPNGERQIQALQQRFDSVSIDAAYSSDLIRTQLTAGAICIPKNLPLHLDPGLREIHMGDWEDKTWGEVRHFDGERLTLFNHSDPSFRAPGEGEDSAVPLGIGSIMPCAPLRKSTPTKISHSSAMAPPSGSFWVR